MSTDDAPAAGLPGGTAETHSRAAALARLGDGLGARHPFLLLTGEPGVGKTSLVGELRLRWGERAIVAVVESGAASPTELIERILRGFGIEPPVNVARPQLLDRLERHIAEAEGSGQVPVIVIDDAHALADDVLAELWAPAKLALMTQRPLEIVLLGHPALETRLAEPAFESIAQHIAVRCHVAAGAHTLEKTAPSQPAAPPAPVAKPDPPAPVAKPAPAPRAAATPVAPAKPAKPAETPPPPKPVKAQAPAPPPPPIKPPTPAEPHPVSETVPTEHVAGATATAAANAPDAGLRVGPPTPKAPDDPRVRDWLERFIKPDEPRFGDLLGTPPPPSRTAVFDPSPPPEDEEVSDDAIDVEVRTPAAFAPHPRGGRRRRERRRRSGSSSQKPWAIRMIPVGAILLLVAGVAIVLIPRGRPTAPSDPRATVAPVATPTRKATAAAPRSAAPAARTPAAAATAAPAAEKTESEARFALDVGTQPYADWADDERDRIVAETGLKGWVIEERRDGVAAYRIVLGVYRTRERAQQSGEFLLSRDLVSEAKVIPLPPRRLRR